jgi:hypothetical protein
VLAHQIACESISAQAARAGEGVRSVGVHGAIVAKPGERRTETQDWRDFEAGFVSFVGGLKNA